jgi:hypothetical protein
VDDHFLKLALGQAVVLGAGEVALELLHVASADERCDGDQAAISFGQLGAFPDVAEQDIVGEGNQLGAKSPMARWSGSEMGSP